MNTVTTKQQAISILNKIIISSPDTIIDDNWCDIILNEDLDIITRDNLISNREIKDSFLLLSEYKSLEECFEKYEGYSVEDFLSLYTPVDNSLQEIALALLKAKSLELEKTPTSKLVFTRLKKELPYLAFKTIEGKFGVAFPMKEKSEIGKSALTLFNVLQKTIYVQELDAVWGIIMITVK